MQNKKLPKKQGLYDPEFEKDSCGVGFIVDMKGEKSHKVIQDGLEILKKLEHRGACGADAKTGDGAGILIQHMIMRWIDLDSRTAYPFWELEC